MGGPEDGLAGVNEERFDFLGCARVAIRRDFIQEEHVWVPRKQKCQSRPLRLAAGELAPRLVELAMDEVELQADGSDVGVLPPPLRLEPLLR